MKKILLFGALTTLMLQSCAGKKGSEAIADLKGTSWMLTEIQNIEIKNTDFAKIPELNFNPSTNEFTGNTGCNSMFGKIDISDNKINFGSVGSTKMACEGIGENHFLAAMQTVQTFKLSNKKLELYDGLGNEALSFSKK
ncbi:META domain-containing protein [Flavobacterium sp. NST-5]|uniref:META domain-containing protein n=1 Tax=Flavobacterium ichthyis TaxID=2698827 RepID=A0ABW9Z9D0_9FLAO|nr:META domain-containing protein [Flavobacterium ichthyis]NBL65182.1 META domain-containing protein [Flavobacterium ichthyis]